MNPSRTVLGRASLPGTLALALACGEGGAQFVALPDHGLPTTVLAHRDAGELPFTIRVVGVQAGSSDALPADSEVFALHYAERSAELGLEAGGQGRCSLLSPRFQERLEGDRFERRVGPLPDALAQSLVGDPERCSPCRALNMHSVAYVEKGTLAAGIWLDSGPVVSSGHEGFRRVDRERSASIPGCALQNPLLKFAAIARSGPNTYWVGSEGGELMRVRFDASATTCTVETATVTPSLPGRRPGLLDVRLDPFDPDPELLYALVEDGRILRYDRGRFELIGDLSLHPIDAERNGAQDGQLLFTEVGRGLATVGWNQVAWWGPSGVERVDELQLPFNQFIRDGGQRVTALAYDAREDRLLAGAAQGLVFAHDPSANAWIPTLQLPIMKEVRAFEDFGDRWLLVIEQGDLVVWHRETGLCPKPIRMPSAVNSGRCAHHARRGSELAVFDALGDDDRPMGVVWIQEE